MSENVTYVRGALKTMAAQAATPQRDELEAGPGHGPCPNHATFRAPPGAAGEESNQRDQQGP